MAAGIFTPYSTVSGYFAPGPSWIPEVDKERIQAYQTYEEIFWNHPETFKLVVRGTEDLPIYIPSGRIIVETMDRYVAPRLAFAVEAAAGTQPGSVTELAQQVFDDFFRRETMRSKFNGNKLYGIMRGDSILHIVADPNKPEGTRVSIRPVDPGSYFPVYDDDDLDKLIKVHLAEEFADDQGKVFIKKQTYERLEDGTITNTVAVYDPDKAFKADGSGAPEYILVPTTPLPPEITSFPVYVFKNFEEPLNPFGSSEMRGLERIMSAMNQSMSDEDLSLALDGLGVYSTSGNGPVDENGNEVDWVIGPGRVVENAPDFKRVSGIGSVTPYGDHIDRLWQFMKMAGGTPDSAIGKVDVQIAESGVARAMDLAPILAKAEKKTDLAADKLDHLFFDLRAWFSVFERYNLEQARIHPVFGDPLPQNRKGEVDLVSTMVTGKIMSTTTARNYLATLGFKFADNEQELIDAATAQEAASVDPYGARFASEDGSEDAGGQG